MEKKEIHYSVRNVSPMTTWIVWIKDSHILLYLIGQIRQVWVTHTSFQGAIYSLTSRPYVSFWPIQFCVLCCSTRSCIFGSVDAIAMMHNKYRYINFLLCNVTSLGFPSWNITLAWHYFLKKKLTKDSTLYCYTSAF